MRVSWWRWRLVHYALVLVAAVAVVPELADLGGYGYAVVGYVLVWGILLTTAATSADLTERELVVRAPLRVARIPLADVVLTWPRFLPTARVGRRGRSWAAVPVPYTRDTQRLFLAVERARGSSRGTP